MSQKHLNVGAAANDHTGTNRRVAWQYTEDNFSDVFARLSQTINAGDVRFASGPTNEAQIQLAVNQALIELAPRVFIPASKLPFDISLLNLTAFNASGARLVWEGGDWTVYDVRAYGADPSGALDAGPSWNACRGAVPSAGGQMRVTNGTYKMTTAFTFNAQQNVTVQIDAGVTLTGANSTLPVVTGQQPVSPDYNAYIDARGGVLSLSNRLIFPARVAGRGPAIIDHAETIFNGTADPGVSIGYNWRAGGPVLAAEPAVAWVVEGNYNDGSGQNKIEAYLSIFPDDFPTHAELRPYFASYNRVTRTASPYIAGDAIYFGRSTTSGGGGDPIGSFTNDGVNGNNFNIGACTYNNGTFLSVQAKAGQNADLMLGLVGSTYARLSMATNLRLDVKVNNRSTAHFYASTVGNPGDGFAVGADDNSAVGMFANAGHIVTKGLVARGVSGQTGLLFEAQNNSSASLWSVTAAGFMAVGANQVVSARKTGWTAWTGTAARGTQNADGPPTLTQVSQAFKALLDDLISHGLVGT